MVSKRVTIPRILFEDERFKVTYRGENGVDWNASVIVNIKEPHCWRYEGKVIALYSTTGEVLISGRVTRASLAVQKKVRNGAHIGDIIVLPNEKTAIRSFVPRGTVVARHRTIGDPRAKQEQIRNDTDERYLNCDERTVSTSVYKRKRIIAVVVTAAIGALVLAFLYLTRSPEDKSADNFTDPKTGIQLEDTVPRLAPPVPALDREYPQTEVMSDNLRSFLGTGEMSRMPTLDLHSIPNQIKTPRFDIPKPIEMPRLDMMALPEPLVIPKVVEPPKLWIPPDPP